MQDGERPHRSHSQLSRWLGCGKEYELERVAGVQPRPAWWLAGGTAVHTTIERWLRQQIQGETK